MPTFHLIIKGKVQGVFYRATAKEMADKMNVKGWIKNTRQGDVEAEIYGNEKDTENFIAWCRQGPSKAKVEEVKILPLEEVVYDEFSVLR